MLHCQIHVELAHKSLGNVTQSATTTFRKAYLVDNINEPFAKIIFRYRPLGKYNLNMAWISYGLCECADLLRAQGIAPMTQDLEREQSTEPGSRLEQRGAGKRSSEGDAGSSAKKRRSDDPKVRVKRERGEGPSRKGQLAEMKV